MSNLVGGKIQKLTAKKLLESGKHNTQSEHICPVCNKIGKGPGMFRWHFKNCKEEV